MAGWFYSKPFRRNNYFYGKLLTSRDFNNEQEYINNKRRLINESVLGSGVISGLGVEVNEKDIILQPGAAIDPCGRELVIANKAVYAISDLLADPAAAENGIYCVCLTYDESESEETFSVINSDLRDSQQKAFNYVTEEFRVSLVKEDEMPKWWRSVQDPDLYKQIKDRFFANSITDYNLIVKPGDAENAKPVQKTGKIRSGEDFIRECLDAYRGLIVNAIDADDKSNLPVCVAKLHKNGKDYKIADNKDLKSFHNGLFVFNPAFLYDMAIEAFERLMAVDANQSSALDGAVSLLTTFIKNQIKELSTTLSGRIDQLEKRTGDHNDQIIAIKADLKELNDEAITKINQQINYLSDLAEKFINEIKNLSNDSINIYNQIKNVTVALDAAVADFDKKLNDKIAMVNNNIASLNARVDEIIDQSYNDIEFILESPMKQNDILLSDPVNVDYQPGNMEFEYQVPPFLDVASKIKVEYDISIVTTPAGKIFFQFRFLSDAPYINKIILRWRIIKRATGKKISVTPKSITCKVGTQNPIKIYIDNKLQISSRPIDGVQWKAVLLKGGDEIELEKPDTVTVEFIQNLRSYRVIANSEGSYKLTALYQESKESGEFSDSIKIFAE